MEAVADLDNPLYSAWRFTLARIRPMFVDPSETAAKMVPSESPRYHWEVDGPSPPFPYIPGFAITIRPSTSPSAERDAQAEADKILKARYPPGFHKISAIKYSIAHPACELEIKWAGNTRHHADEHILHVDSIITRPASDVFWNVVRCHLDDHRESRCIAKIYDPVYSSDVMFAQSLANGQFNNEAKAYVRLEGAGISGKVTPVFLGGWNMDVPVPSTDFGGVDYATTRPVGLLLFEDVTAADLASTYCKHYFTSGYVEAQPQLPRAWKLEVLAKIYEADALLRNAGVDSGIHMDHVWVGTSELVEGKSDIRVFITNFGRANIQVLEEHIGETLARPESPIETFWDEVTYNAYWLTLDIWTEDESLEDYRQWLVQRWGDSTEYRPLPEKLRKRVANGSWGKNEGR
ncbi:hypothetical protein J7T55_000537 [Diaporthe amygdali]|uniref:uncharacterized protein n=1 Tax=Phomopsis amygdali TaxID=1214568 RepID=UPI0022FEF2EC|nr:uncharacterized protein J7T55_000537 [Diaporthe amygdali]KAJ0104186.1 hypothetical protein J7T55_000537 [Diaporthe amygdali]